MTTDFRLVTVLCPYCGHDNRIRVHTSEENSPRVALCEIEDGPGCDRYFAVEVSFSPTVKTFTLETTHTHAAQEAP